MGRRPGLSEENSVQRLDGIVMGTVFSKSNTLYQVFSYSNGKTNLLTARSGDHGAIETVFRYFRLVVENMSGYEGTI